MAFTKSWGLGYLFGYRFQLRLYLYLYLSVKLSVADQVLRKTYEHKLPDVSSSCLPGWQRKCCEGGLPGRQCPQPPQHPGCHHSMSHPLLVTHTNLHRQVCFTPVHIHIIHIFWNDMQSWLSVCWPPYQFASSLHHSHSADSPNLLHWHTCDSHIDL